MKPQVPQTLSPYEQEAWLEIYDFKNPDSNWLSAASDALQKPIDKISKRAFDSKVGETVEAVLSSVVSAMNDLATWSVRTDAILEAFTDRKHAVDDFSDIQKLSLEQVEEVIGHLGRKYRTIAAVEGSVTGSFSAPGMVVDIPLILTIAMRGVTETAAYYGYFPATDEERVFAMNVVAAASAPTPSRRQSAIVDLTEHSVDLVSGTSPATTVLSIQFVERVMESIVARMARGKIGQVVPMFGSLIGGGFNRWFVAQVMQTAEMMYRERFLVRAHGDGVVVPVEGANAVG